MIQIDLQSRVPLYEQLQEQIIRLSPTPLQKLISSWSNRASSTPYREGEALFHRMSFPCNRCGRQPCRRFWTLWTRR